MAPILTWWVKTVKYTRRLSHLPAVARPALYAGGNTPRSGQPSRGEDVVCQRDTGQITSLNEAWDFGDLQLKGYHYSTSKTSVIVD